MKKWTLLLICFIAVTVAVAAPVTLNYMESGSRWVIGGSFDVASGGDMDIESGASLKIAGTAITATAAEINASSDITTPGVAEASKAVVLGPSKEIATITSATITTLTSTTVEAPTITNASLVLESLNPMTVKLNDTNALQLDNAAISGFAGGNNAAGTAVYIETQDGGSDAAVNGGNAGGEISIKTGDGGAGGADQVGAAGGAVVISGGAGGAGGAHTAANPNGGNGADVTLSAGSGGAAGSGGSGVAGRPGVVKVGNGCFLHEDSQTINMADTTVTLTLVPGTPVGTTQTSNVLFVDAQSAGTSETLLMVPEANADGMTVYIHNVGGENITVKEDSDSTVLGLVAPDAGSVFYCDGTTWQGGTTKQNMTATYRLTPWDMRGTGGDALTTSDVAGSFFINVGGASSGLSLLGEISNGTVGADTETSVMRGRFNVPMNYVAGQSFVVSLESGLFGAGAVTATPTIDLTAKLLDVNGTLAADICATAAQNLVAGEPAPAAFTITPTTITPGSVLELEITTVVDNTNSTDIQSEVSGITIDYTANI